jgi:hypothetical protein
MTVAMAVFALGAAWAETTPMERLAGPGAWRVEGDPLPLSSEAGWLAAGLAPAGGETRHDLLLTEPIVLPDGHDVFFDAALGTICPTLMNALVRDADGHPFLFFTESYSTIQRGNFLGGRFRGGLDELGIVRVRVPGLASPVPESFRPLDAGHRTPVPPFAFLGLRLERKEALEQDTALYLSNFRVTGADFRTEPFYYGFKDAEYFGAADGAPALRPTDFGRIWGDRHLLDWELRATYDGQPLLCGNRTFEFAPDDATPFKLRFAGALRLPALPEGTYWIRAKLRSGFQGEAPAFLRELEFRYDVFRNASPDPLPEAPIPAGARIGAGHIRIAPERPSFTWGAEEAWRTTVRFFDAAGCTARIEVAAGDGRVLLAREHALDAGEATIPLDLSTLPPGAYTVTARLVSPSGATLDTLARLVGRRSRPSDAARFRRPADTPDWRDIRDGPEQLVLFCPMIHDPARTVEHYANLFDEMVASGVSRAAEIQTSWNECEPLQGVYDFSVIDGVLDEAAARGIRCFVTFAPLAPPEWVPSHFTRDAEGYRFGHTAYLFHGGRFNLFQDPQGRRAALDYLRALVLHVRNHPGLLGYFYISEHSGEAPWAGWYEGFDPDTLANFRAAMRKRYRTIARANRAWGTAFGSFDAVRPPSVRDEAPMAFRRDWLLFRRNGIYDFILESAKTIRDLDPHRIVMVYLDGVINTRLSELAAFGVISANGGCAVPESTFLQGAYAEAGVPQRAEEISCTQWSWIPFQLDRSLFNMMGGGGANGHWKMFIPQDAKFADLRREPHSLDRFESFIPLWRELREARPVFGDIRIWAGFEGQLVRSRSVNTAGLDCGGWEARAFLDAQLPLGMNATPAWKKAKCVLVSPGQTILSAAEADDLARFARKGGTLFLTADSGRRIIGHEGEDWCLLRRLGFGAPLSEAWDVRHDLQADAAGAWADRGDLRVNVRTSFEPPQDAGEALLRRLDDGVPGLTRKRVGKGRAYVLWYNAVVPHGESGREASGSFFREIARDAGAALPVETSTRLFWTHLLRKGADTWYLLVTSRDQVPDAGTIRLSLPDGDYRVSEAITGRGFPGTSAAALAETGFETRLGYNEVQVWRFERIPPEAPAP